MTYIASKNYLYLPEQVQKNKADINTLRNAFMLEYSDTTEYFKPQIVSVDGVAYIALRDTPFKGHYPPTSPDFWAVFASGGTQGPQGKEGFSLYLADAYIDAETEDVPLADILKPADRTVQPYDILLSTYADTQGAYAYVTAINGNIAKIDYIGTTLQGPQGVSIIGVTINEI